MKKSLYAVVVILLSAVGANALASLIDIQVQKVVQETNDKGGGANSRGNEGGGGGGRFCSTLEK